MPCAPPVTIATLPSNLTSASRSVFRGPPGALWRRLPSSLWSLVPRSHRSSVQAPPRPAGRSQGPPAVLRAPPWRSCGDLRDRLGLQVLLEARHAHLAADAGLLVAAERDGRAVPAAAVRADRPGARARGHRAGAVGAAVHRARQPVRGVVVNADRVVVAVVRHDHEHRAEDLLARGAGVVGQPGDERRLDPEALVPALRAAPAARERPALLDG